MPLWQNKIKYYFLCNRVQVSKGAPNPEELTFDAAWFKMFFSESH